MGYSGPRGGKGDEEYASINWLCGMVVGAVRAVERPGPTKYSRAVMRRIVKGRVTHQTIARVLGWPEKKEA
jgi:hypothetical protein